MSIRLHSYLLSCCLFAEGGTNVDNWEFEALMNVVGEFQQNYQPVPTDGSGQQEDAAAVEVA